jgi:hypothetical protein
MPDIKKIVFTLGSNNYLAQTKVLGDSLLANNPDYHFIIGLVDEKNETINYSDYDSFEILLVKDIGISDFDELWKKYNIVEFNTSVKASYIKFIQKKYPTAEFVFYFDPDIQIFEKLTDLESEFNQNDILLTPHIITPIPLDGYLPTENNFLNYGTYNLGFIGVKNKSDTVNSFLDWWEERTLKVGFSNVAKGYFVDQLWINLAPLYYKRVKIMFEMGYNAGPWNLHERKDLKKTEGNHYLMPDESKLVFYHFSNYKFTKPEIIAGNYNRYPVNYSKDLTALYKQYHDKIIENKIEALGKIECFYVTARLEYIASLQKYYHLKKKVKEYIPSILLETFRKLR